MNSGWRGLLAAAVDLVLPTECPACGAAAALRGVCDDCARRWRIDPIASRPSSAPVGLPACFSAGEYAAELRSLILAYKEHGRRSLAGVLGDALAEVVVAGAGGPDRFVPLALVPVPGTAAANRARQGDHMLRLARRAARRLRGDGWPVRVLRPLRALPKPDSAQLGRAARALAAQDAFALRSRRLGALRRAADGVVVVLDDVLTTGATIAAVSRALHRAGAPVSFAATIAATRLRNVPYPARTG